MTESNQPKEGALRQIQVLLGASKAARAEGLSGDLIVTHAEIKALSDDRWQLNEAAYENAMTALKTADERDEWRRKCGNARNKVDELARMDREDAESIGMALVAAIPDDAVWDQSPVELYIRAINERDEARNALSKAESKLRDEEERHALLQSRCFEGFPSASDGIFDAQREDALDAARYRYLRSTKAYYGNPDIYPYIVMGMAGKTIPLIEEEVDDAVDRAIATPMDWKGDPAEAPA